MDFVCLYGLSALGGNCSGGRFRESRRAVYEGCRYGGRDPCQRACDTEICQYGSVQRGSDLYGRRQFCMDRH